ncbi:class I SAM-dependent methyltransferase [Streptomyces sp. NPDC005438]|uniref:class I SAM-dependent methyltransferase n=1 Tax=Streptomyces sp. NPDC005438 TaxID=3156880 RepID=UPI0033B1743B
MRFDRTGKVSLHEIYTQPDPRAYFQTLRHLDYQVPQRAKPHFAHLLRAYREARGVDRPRVLDIGSSYGVNAALQRCELTMDELYERYGSHTGPLTREQLLRRDRALVDSRPRPDPAHYTGLDTSGPALDYGRRAGYLDATVHADLEHHDPTPEQRAALGADLVVSTGCLGYVTERTLERVLAAQDGRRPWMAHFVLRMFPFRPVERLLESHGYRTETVPGVHRQRRFASTRERSQVLATMAEAGVPTEGLEDTGWLHARLHVSTPRP